MDDFFVGYDPPMPPALRRFVARTSVIVILGAAGLAALLALGHRTLDGGQFAYGSYERVTGRIAELPHPRVYERGQARSGATLLVATGKHGAAALVRGLDGRDVTLVGSRIGRDGYRMLEVQRDGIEPAPIDAPADRGRQPASGVASNRVTLRGEVVDSKCFLGVMVPGEGHTHGSCASLCLRGGIPAALLTQDRSGARQLYLLETPDGGPLGPAVAPWAGRLVVADGVTGSRDGWLTLRTTPAQLRAVP